MIPSRISTAPPACQLVRPDQTESSDYRLSMWRIELGRGSFGAVIITLQIGYTATRCPGERTHRMRPWSERCTFRSAAASAPRRSSTWRSRCCTAFLFLRLPRHLRPCPGKTPTAPWRTGVLPRPRSEACMVDGRDRWRYRASSRLKEPRPSAEGPRASVTISAPSRCSTQVGTTSTTPGGARLTRTLWSDSSGSTTTTARPILVCQPGTVNPRFVD
jgi:hypothetical protein